jgi:hypothetical protein
MGMDTKYCLGDLLGRKDWKAADMVVALLVTKREIVWGRVAAVVKEQDVDLTRREAAHHERVKMDEHFLETASCCQHYDELDRGFNG